MDESRDHSARLAWLDIVAGRPRASLRLADFARIRDSLRSASAEEVDAVILHSGIDAQFCFGADLDDAVEHRERAEEYVETVSETWTAIETAEVAVVVAADGPVVGAGFEMCLCADAVVATDRSHFSFPEVRFGMPALSAADRLEAMVDRAVARRILLTGARVSAVEAQTLGFVSDVVVPEELEAAAVRAADSFAASDAHAVRALKDRFRSAPVRTEEMVRWFHRAFEATPEGGKR